MQTLKWQVTHFEQLSNHQLYELLKLRVQVFVVEQNCPYPELDDKDTHIETRHLTAYSDSTLFAYARLLSPGVSYPEISIGRFVVDQAVRRKGIGAMLMDKCLEEKERLWPECNIRISAQEYLQNFYEQFGFEKVSDTYLEDNMPHIAMLREP